MNFRISNVTKSFGKKQVLRGINLDITRPGLYAIVGRSGEGKSTLLNILSGQDSPISGSIYVDNMSISTQDLPKYSALVFQSANLINGMTVRDNIKLVCEISGKKIADEEIDTICEKLDIKDLLDKKVDFLSGGERQRVAIVRAYLTNRQIILADEPTGNLDDDNAIKVFELMQEVAKTKIVILVSHDVEFVNKYCDNIYAIQSGVLHCKRKTDRDYHFENSTSNTKPKMSASTYFKLIKNILTKRKFIYSFIVLSMILIMASSVVLTGFGMTSKVYMLNDNQAKDISTVVSAKLKNGGMFFDDEFDSFDGIKVNKGFNINTIYEYSYDGPEDEEQSLYPYALQGMTLHSFVELNHKGGINLIKGEFPSKYDEVILPEFFIESAIFHKFEIGGRVIQNIEEVVGLDIKFYGDDYHITGVYASDARDLEIAKKYTFKDIEEERIPEEVAVLFETPYKCPSLTTVYFGEGFQDYFLAKYYGIFDSIKPVPNGLVKLESEHGQPVYPQYSLLDSYSGTLGKHTANTGEVYYDAITGSEYNIGDEIIIKGVYSNSMREDEYRVKVVDNTSSRGIVLSRELFKDAGISKYNFIDSLSFDIRDMSTDKYEQLSNIYEFTTDHSATIDVFWARYEETITLIKTISYLMIAASVLINLICVNQIYKDNRKTLAILSSYGGKGKALSALLVSIMGVVILSIIASQLIGVTLLSLINGAVTLTTTKLVYYNLPTFIINAVSMLGIVILTLLVTCISVTKGKIVKGMKA